MANVPLNAIAGNSQSPPIRRWQTIGYPIFSEFLATDDELFIVRRFKSLNVRLILKMQDEICKLEEDLKKCDKLQMQAVEPVNNGSFRRDKVTERKKLLDDIQVKMKEYNEFVVSHSELRARPPAQERQIQNILNWHQWNPNAIRNEELSYINETEDLITVAPCPKSPLKYILERSKWFSTLSWMHRKVENSHSLYDPSAFSIVDERKANSVDTALVLFIGLVLFIVPIWVLQFAAKNSKVKLGIISAFITLFLIGVQLVTGAKPGETLAATAAYSAVLMIFIQTTSS